MGASYSQGSSSQGSMGASQTVGTRLSRIQADILEKREEQYQEYFFPELIDQLEEANKTGDNALFKKTARGIESSSRTAKNALSESMSKRGIQDSGMAAAGELSVEQAKGASLAEAYFNSQLANKEKAMQLLQMGGSFSPTPTTAAPYGMQSQSHSWGSSKNIGISGNIM